MTRAHFKDSRRPYYWCERALLEMGLSVYEIAIYSLLAAYADHDGRSWPSYKHIAGRLGIGRRTVIRGMERLARMGALRKTTQRDGQTGRGSNIYELVDLPVLSKANGDKRATGAPETPPSATGTPPSARKVLGVVPQTHSDQGVTDQGVSHETSAQSDATLLVKTNNSHKGAIYEHLHQSG